jgi:transposase
VVHRPGQRQSISAASAVNANGAFWFCTYEGALNAELFVELLQTMMQYRKKPVHLVLDSLPAHKKAIVRDYVTSTKGKLTLHFLPGYAPDLNPDELVLESCQAHWHGKAPLAEGREIA